MLLDADLASAVVCLTSGTGLVGPRPLGAEDGALYPLGCRGAKCLFTALSGLLLQVVDDDINDFVCEAENFCSLKTTFTS